ncbi:MAG: protein kinase [Vicinamibacterales bacterium]
MRLAAGDHLGPYEILSLIGSGGMGEVYRARDPRLHRVVAIKVLPSSHSTNLEFRARFEREARTVARLSHPHICAVYDVGTATMGVVPSAASARQADERSAPDGVVQYLVIEHLDGVTLATRLSQGPIAVDEALTLARQLAEALDHAHRAGIVHRDLKPGNVMLTPSGAKLLDFGLARDVLLVGSDRPSDASTESPLTGAGLVLGTVPYMSPEQIEGKPADARSDLFAFGAILYEMVTGRRAFPGNSAASVMSAVLRDTPPPLASMQPMTPPALAHIVERCLAKDPDERWQSARDLARELRWTSTLSGAAAVTTRPPMRRRHRWLLPVGVAALVFGTGVLVSLWRREPPSPPVGPSVQFPIAVPGTAMVMGLPEEVMAISPDGRFVAAAFPDRLHNSRLFLRSLAEPEMKPIDETRGAIYPFWSPDSRSLAYGAAGVLRRIDIASGHVSDICPAPTFGGGSWNRQGTIVFVSDNKVYRVSAYGTQGPKQIAADDPGWRTPTFLTDDEHYLLPNVPGRVEVRALTSAAVDALVLRAASVAPTAGHLLYTNSAGTWARPFDATSRAMVTERDIAVAARYEGLVPRSISASPGGSIALTFTRAFTAQLIRFNRAGQATRVLGPPADTRGLRLSPDGTKLLVHRHDPVDFSRGDIWIANSDSAAAFKVVAPTIPSDNTEPIWSMNGASVVFMRASGTMGIYVKSADGSGVEKQIVDSKPLGQTFILTDGTPDGKSWVGLAVSPRNDVDIASIPSDGSQTTPTLLTSTPFNEMQGQLSPDGNWIAYVSDESGRNEVYVASYPAIGGRQQVSSDGGIFPRWRRDGRELFYLDGDRTLMSAVASSRNELLSFAPPVPLFKTRALMRLNAYWPYDVAPDGQSFIIATEPDEPAPSPYVVITNWRPSTSNQP